MNSAKEDKWLLCWPRHEEFHVIPIGDALDHEDEECACLPRVEVVRNGDGSFAAFGVSHNAWDGRE